MGQILLITPALSTDCRQKKKMENELRMATNTFMLHWKRKNFDRRQHRDNKASNGKIYKKNQNRGNKRKREQKIKEIQKWHLIFHFIVECMLCADH